MKIALEHLPPNLPERLRQSDRMRNDYFIAKMPITRYWHYQKRADYRNIPPPGVPLWLSNFDWVIGWKHGWANPKLMPRTVFCHPDVLSWFAYFLLKNFPQPKPHQRLLIVGGDDRKLSHQSDEVINILTQYFSNIDYESYDIERSDIGIFPMGFTEYYLRGAKPILNDLKKPFKKQENLLCAFGAIWPHLNRTIRDRQLALLFVQSRNYITQGPFPIGEYFNQLKQHKAMICPLGNGMQSPKIYEALLAFCMPIMTASPTSRRLIEIGVPILEIKSWEALDLIDINLEYAKRKDRINRFQEVLNDYQKFNDYFGYSKFFKTGE